MTNNSPSGVIKLNPFDNVAVLITAMQKGEWLAIEHLMCNDDIPMGHKQQGKCDSKIQPDHRHSHA